MFEKARELFRRPTPAPQQAIVPVRQQLQLFDAQRVIKVIEDRKAQLNARSYLELVPAEYRAAIAEIAQKAYPVKSAGMTEGEFTEKMALEWLAKREIFDQVCQQSGFTAKDRVSMHDERPILALTQNGSIVGLAQGSGVGPREIIYGRIELRENTDILPFQQGMVMGPIMLQGRLQTSRFNTSQLIALAVRRNPGDQLEAPGQGNADLNRSVICMTRAFDDLGKTIWTPRKN